MVRIINVFLKVTKNVSNISSFKKVKTEIMREKWTLHTIN